MVEASQQQPRPGEEAPDLPILFDPNVLRVARQIWSDYAENHGERSKQPLGAAVNQVTKRGHLLFRTKPILLPNECFVPFNQFETLVPQAV